MQLGKGEKRREEKRREEKKKYILICTDWDVKNEVGGACRTIFVALL